MRQEAYKSIYGTAKWHNDFDLAKASSKMPPFKQMMTYVHSESQTIMGDKSKIVRVGNHSLPFIPKVYLEVSSNFVYQWQTTHCTCQCLGFVVLATLLVT